MYKFSLKQICFGISLFSIVPKLVLEILNDRERSRTQTHISFVVRHVHQSFINRFLFTETVKFILQFQARVIKIKTTLHVLEINICVCFVTGF